MQVIYYSFISDYSCFCTADQAAVVIYIFCAAANTCLFLVTPFRLINRSGIVEFLKLGQKHTQADQKCKMV